MTIEDTGSVSDPRCCFQLSSSVVAVVVVSVSETDGGSAAA
jgi:hypothetical protein